MNIYQLIDYRFLIIFPLLLLTFAILNIPNLKLGTEFTGGTLIIAVTDKPITTTDLENKFSNYSGITSNVYETPNGYQIEIEIKKSEEIEKIEKLKNELNDMFNNYTNALFQGNLTVVKEIEYKIRLKAQGYFLATNHSLNKTVEEMNMNEIDLEIGNAYNNFLNNYYSDIEVILRNEFQVSSLSINTITPTLSERFIQEARNVFIYSAIISFIIVFVYFRSFVPAIAVLLGAASDILIALGFMAFFNIPLTFPSFAALLMLIGFSLDTDMLLTIRILKKKELPAKERAFDAMKTGITMTITSLLSFSLLFIISNYLRISTYYEIAATAILGLIGDIFATWCLNAVIILNHVETLEKKNK
ncbi:MAG: hypothetical protein QW076_01630 [Candidatus Anstonellales archaeon]